MMSSDYYEILEQRNLEGWVLTNSELEILKKEKNKEKI